MPRPASYDVKKVVKHHVIIVYPNNTICIDGKDERNEKRIASIFELFDIPKGGRKEEARTSFFKVLIFGNVDRKKGK